MKPSEAKVLTKAATDLMEVVYGKPVFDECVLIGTGAKGSSIIFYEGPRADSFKKTFAADVAALKSAVAARHCAVGDFEFFSDGKGTQHDAFIRTGDNSFLICNNTTQTIAEIRRDARWIAAQKVFVDLGAKFAAHPLEL